MFVAVDSGDGFRDSKADSMGLANSWSELRFVGFAVFLDTSGFLLVSQALEKSAFLEGSLEIASASLDLV